MERGECGDGGRVNKIIKRESDKGGGEGRKKRGK